MYAPPPTATAMPPPPAVTHDDLSLRKAQERRAARSGGQVAISLVALSVLCGLVAFILCLAAEGSRSEARVALPHERERQPGAAGRVRLQRQWPPRARLLSRRLHPPGHRHVRRARLHAGRRRRPGLDLPRHGRRPRPPARRVNNRRAHLADRLPLLPHVDLLRSRRGDADDRHRRGVRPHERLAEAAARVPPGAAGDVRGGGDPGARHRRRRLRRLHHGRAGAAPAGQTAVPTARRRSLRGLRRSPPGRATPAPAPAGAAPTRATPASGTVRAGDNGGAVRGATQPCVSRHQGGRRRRVKRLKTNVIRQGTNKNASPPLRLYSLPTSYVSLFIGLRAVKHRDISL